jgi:hypothetical protein
MIERAEGEQKSQTKPCWSWSGAEALNFSEQTDLRPLIAMLAGKQSSDEQILGFLVDLRARFQRWLHQDEFGPTRRQQTAALSAFKKSLQTLRRQLVKGAPSQRQQLDATLRRGSDCSAATLERIYEAAGDFERDLRIAGASNRKIDWAVRIKTWAETTMAQGQSLDTNADGEILLTTLQHRFDPLQACPPDFGLTEAEQWLSAYWNVVDRTLCRLNERGGAGERMSLKILVEQLCELWERETGRPVTAHGMIKLEYTQRTETEAGRFVTSAVEAMLPESSWFDEHSEFSQPIRAETFRPYRQADRARQIVVIMRDFVKRRSKIQDDALHKKLALNSVNAEPVPSPVPVRDHEKPRPPLPPPDADRARKLSPAHRDRADD